MVEPDGIEPTTSTMPLLFALIPIQISRYFPKAWLGSLIAKMLDLGLIWGRKVVEFGNRWQWDQSAVTGCNAGNFI